MRMRDEIGIKRRTKVSRSQEQNLNDVSIFPAQSLLANDDAVACANAKGFLEA